MVHDSCCGRLKDFRRTPPYDRLPGNFISTLCLVLSSPVGFTLIEVRTLSRQFGKKWGALGKRVIHSCVPEPLASGDSGGVGNDLHIGR